VWEAHLVPSDKALAIGIGIFVKEEGSKSEQDKEFNNITLLPQINTIALHFSINFSFLLTELCLIKCLTV